MRTRQAPPCARASSQLASAAEIVPYAESWFAPNLAAARTNLGLNNAILAFGISRGGCALEPGLASRLPDARQFVNQGGKLAISMGGADGTYAEIACSDDQLFTLVEKLILDSTAQRIDWDVEGSQLNNTDATARRNRVLVRLQRLMAPEPAALFRLLQRPPAWIADEDLQELRESSEEFSAVLTDMSSLQERIKLLQEEIAATINERSSRSLYTLTVFTVVALPINLIAGLFGMNVAGIPLAEHAHGFWMVVGLIASVTSFLLWRLTRQRGER